MLYGNELITKLEDDLQKVYDRHQTYNYEDSYTRLLKKKINLILNGGCEWFPGYATLDGKWVDARWCNTKFGRSLRAEMPDGSVVWTTSTTDKGLAKKGLKRVECYRPAWFTTKYDDRGELFPSNTNYATGEDAPKEPLDIREVHD